MAQSIKQPTSLDIRVLSSVGQNRCHDLQEHMLVSRHLRQINRIPQKMSFTPPFKYISAPELAALVKRTDIQEVQVVDVRDDDFVG